MEITHMDDSVLPQEQQKAKFYDTMNRVVVLVRCELKKYHTNEIISSTGGGIVMDKRGYILTAATLVPKKREGTSQLHVHFKDNVPYPVIPIHTDYNKGVAVLKFIDKLNDDWNYGKFADETITIGLQTFTIGHPNRMHFSFLEGHVCYLCIDPMTPNPSKCRSINDLRNLSSVEGEVPEDLEDSLPIIQVKNPSVTSDFRGSPLFNSHGHVIGMYLFNFAKFDWAIHFEPLKKSFEDVLSHSEFNQNN